MSAAMPEARWRDYPWRLIRGEPLAPPMNLALDEVLTRHVGADERPPTLRFWDWAAPAVVLGRFQSVENEVDEETADGYGVEVVRRMTGGGAMFGEPENIITYSIYAPPKLVAGMSSVDSYAFFDVWVVEALRSLGVGAWYEPINDITSSDGKIGGAAQARRTGAVLHHVMMSYEMDVPKMLRVLRIGQEKLTDKAIQSAEKRVGPLRRQTQLPREEIIRRMISTFEQNAGTSLVQDRIAPEELAEAEELVRTKYGTREWTYLVP
jgi:lipoate---protein ligase